MLLARERAQIHSYFRHNPQHRLRIQPTDSKQIDAQQLVCMILHVEAHQVSLLFERQFRRLLFCYVRQALEVLLHLRFDLYVEHFLVSELIKGDIVLLDNVNFHYSQRAISLIEAAGARVEHLPAYSPDFNPIEECISKIKAILRSLKARTKRK